MPPSGCPSWAPAGLGCSLAELWVLNPTVCPASSYQLLLLSFRTRAILCPALALKKKKSSRGLEGLVEESEAVSPGRGARWEEVSEAAGFVQRRTCMALQHSCFGTVELFRFICSLLCPRLTARPAASRSPTLQPGPSVPCWAPQSRAGPLGAMLGRSAVLQGTQVNSVRIR